MGIYQHRHPFYHWACQSWFSKPRLCAWFLALILPFLGLWYYSGQLPTLSKDPMAYAYVMASDPDTDQAYVHRLDRKTGTLIQRIRAPLDFDKLSLAANGDLFLTAITHNMAYQNTVYWLPFGKSKLSPAFRTQEYGPSHVYLIQDTCYVFTGQNRVGPIYIEQYAYPDFTFQTATLIDPFSMLLDGIVWTGTQFWGSARDYDSFGDPIADAIFSFDPSRQSLDRSGHHIPNIEYVTTMAYAKDRHSVFTGAYLKPEQIQHPGPKSSCYPCRDKSLDPSSDHSRRELAQRWASQSSSQTHEAKSTTWNSQVLELSIPDGQQIRSWDLMSERIPIKEMDHYQGLSPPFFPSDFQPMDLLLVPSVGKLYIISYMVTVIDLTNNQPLYHLPIHAQFMGLLDDATLAISFTKISNDRPDDTAPFSGLMILDARSDDILNVIEGHFGPLSR